MKRIILVLFCLTLIRTVGWAEDASFLQNYTTNNVSLVAGFVPDASRVIVGEPLFLTFVVSNRAEMPFQFCRVNTEIFSFTATNTSGKSARNPFLHMMDGNGFVSSVKVDSGKPFVCRLFLNGWCEFDEPGDYTVTCRCKLGGCFTQTNSFGALEQPIVTVFKLTVLPSNPKRIAEIINEWATVIETNGPLGEAAQALAEFNDPRIIPPLAALVEKDANNYVAVNALARFTNAAAADALAVVLKSGEDYEAGVARTAITKSHQADRIARSFLPGLTSAEANVRIQNARAMGWAGSEVGFAPLCALLKDETNTVRYAAAEAIGRLGDVRSFAVLTNLLNDSDFHLRLAAVKGLIALNRPFQANWLTPIIHAGRNNEANFRTYNDAIVLMSISGGDQAAAGLVSCLDFDNPSVKDWYNFYLLQYIGANWEPKYYHYYKWHHDPNRDGTEEELAENRQILSELKAWLEKHKLN
jgi:hypothetical protein